MSVIAGEKIYSLTNPRTGEVIPNRTFKILKVGEPKYYDFGVNFTVWKVSIEFKFSAATEPVNREGTITYDEGDSSYSLTIAIPFDVNGETFNAGVIKNLGAKGGYRRRTRRRIKKNRKNRRRYSRRK